MGARSLGSLSQLLRPGLIALSTGPIAGFPVVDVKATLYDGKAHSVDSSQLAFEIAGRNAFRLNAPSMRPVILEPQMKVDVVAPNDDMGAVMGDINPRRGQIEQMDAAPGGMTQVSAKVPLAEMFNYISNLRSITSGRGNYSMQLLGYEAAPQSVDEQLRLKFGMNAPVVADDVRNKSESF